MAEIKKKPVKIVETVLRDAHQSLIATRMTTEEMLPIVDKMDQVGYHAVECWGGATFDACLRFLKEDPWERLRKLRDGFKNTKLQMLFRGQNILGYKPYPDDVVEYFVQKSIGGHLSSWAPAHAVPNAYLIYQISAALSSPKSKFPLVVRIFVRNDNFSSIKSGIPSLLKHLFVV